MQTLLDIARGPLLYLSFALLIIGTLRQLGLTIAELVRAYRLAGDQAIPFGQLFKRSLGWIVPVNALRGTRIPYTAASLLFHAGVLLVPLFLAGHVALFRKGIGLEWPALPGVLADALTLVALAGLFLLLSIRLLSRASRSMSGFQDWFLLVLAIVPLLTGYLVAHPAQNPLPFSITYLVHLLSAGLLLALIPFTKLAHVILFPLTRISWELGWHFVPGGGDRVRLALGKEGEGV